MIQALENTLSTPDPNAPFVSAYDTRRLQFRRRKPHKNHGLEGRQVTAVNSALSEVSKETELRYIYSAVVECNSSLEYTVESLVSEVRKKIPVYVLDHNVTERIVELSRGSYSNEHKLAAATMALAGATYGMFETVYAEGERAYGSPDYEEAYLRRARELSNAFSVSHQFYANRLVSGRGGAPHYDPRHKHSTYFGVLPYECLNRKMKPIGNELSYFQVSLFRMVEIYQDRSIPSGKWFELFMRWQLDVYSVSLEASMFALIFFSTRRIKNMLRGIERNSSALDKSRIINQSWDLFYMQAFHELERRLDHNTSFPIMISRDATLMYLLNVARFNPIAVTLEDHLSSIIERFHPGRNVEFMALIRENETRKNAYYTNARQAVIKHETARIQTVWNNL